MPAAMTPLLFLKLSPPSVLSPAISRAGYNIFAFAHQNICPQAIQLYPPQNDYNHYVTLFAEVHHTFLIVIFHLPPILSAGFWVLPVKPFSAQMAPQGISDSIASYNWQSGGMGAAESRCVEPTTNISTQNSV